MHAGIASEAAHFAPDAKSFGSATLPADEEMTCDANSSSTKSARAALACDGHHNDSGLARLYGVMGPF
jgi:hypothetical protein